ncbi:MAG: ABC transporter substrate-binding protein, partial [Candidatus Tectomicrobia bacterium]|nr:ABC transporter substrate-binding protein [Candidatus Tectomicrobia bacterium]
MKCHILVWVAALLLTGCIDDARDTPASETAAASETSGDLGAVVVAEGQPVQIRFLGPPTVLESLTEWIRHGINQAIDDFGAIHGRDVHLGATIDTMCSAPGGRSGAEAVVADSQVVGVIGTLCSGAAVAASPVLSDAGMVMISPTNTSPLLTSD